jgi:hypothetical protein
LVVGEAVGTAGGRRPDRVDGDRGDGSRGVVDPDRDGIE